MRWETGKNFTTGFATGLGGLITLPVSVPAGIGSAWIIQARMVGAIADASRSAGLTAKRQFRLDGDEPEIEQPVDVAAKWQTVGQFVTTAVLPRPDVRGFEHWQRALIGDCASAVIGVEDSETEARLPESGRDQLRLAVPTRLGRLGRPLGEVMRLRAASQGIPATRGDAPRRRANACRK